MVSSLVLAAVVVGAAEPAGSRLSSLALQPGADCHKMGGEESDNARVGGSVGVHKGLNTPVACPPTHGCNACATCVQKSAVTAIGRARVCVAIRVHSL